MYVCCEFEKDQLKTLKFTGYTRNKGFWTPGGYKWNRRVLKIDWRLDLGLMHIWCEYEENQLKTQVSGAPTRKTHLPPSGHKWNHKAPKIDWRLDLGARDM